MRTIAYIEIDTHAEIAQAFMEIIQDSREFTVDYYFSKKIKDQIIDNGETIFLSDSSLILDQLKSKRYDLIIIGTVHRYFNTFQTIMERYNSAMIVHNLNFSKISKINLIKSVFKEDIIYRLKLWWKESLIHSSKIYHTARSLLVLDQEMALGQYKYLPVFYTKVFDKAENKDLIIVIPGGVSQKRRDYEHVFSIIKNVKVSENYTFIFLGKAKNHELKQLKTLSENLPGNITIKYFSDRVSSNDFETWMRKADVLWCPIQQKTEFFGQKEIYGVTKMTGNLGDAIKYGKMAVFPRGFSSKLDFIVSEKENIFEQFEELKNSRFDFQKNYGKTIVLRKLEQVLSDLVSI